MTEYTITYNGKDYVKPFVYSEVTEELDELHNRNFTKEDLYKITLWKVNRFPLIRNDTVEKLNSLRLLVFLDEPKTKDVLKDLLKIKGVRLPMASTYLRFLNPDIYQIIDVRAYRAAFCYDNKRPDYTKATDSECIDIYIHYLKRLRDIAENGYYGIKVMFRDLDRFLYDIDKVAGFKINDKIQFENFTRKGVLEQILAK